MPLSRKDKKLKRHFTDEYGDKEGERVMYAIREPADAAH